MTGKQRFALHKKRDMSMTFTRGDFSRRAATTDGSWRSASLRLTAQTLPALRRLAFALRTHSLALKPTSGVSRITTMRLTDAGSAFHAAWKPATFVSSSSLPVGMTTPPAKCETTNTVWISGCLANHFGTWSFHCRHSAWRLAGSFVVARLSGQPERVIDTPRQRLPCATY